MSTAAILMLLGLAGCYEEDHKHYDYRPGSAPQAASGLSEPERMLEQARTNKIMGSPTPDLSSDWTGAPPEGGSITPTEPPSQTTPPQAAPAGTGAPADPPPAQAPP